MAQSPTTIVNYEKAEVFKKKTDRIWEIFKMLMEEHLNYEIRLDMRNTYKFAGRSSFINKA